MCVSCKAGSRHLFIHDAFSRSCLRKRIIPAAAAIPVAAAPINTISADTLSEGLIAASVRYEFIRLGQLSDADLLAAAAKGTHAHSLRSIDAVSLSVAYGVTNDFTVARSRRRRPPLGYQRTRARTC